MRAMNMLGKAEEKVFKSSGCNFIYFMQSPMFVVIEKNIFTLETNLWFVYVYSTLKLIKF